MKKKDDKCRLLSFFYKRIERVNENERKEN